MYLSVVLFASVHICVKALPHIPFYELVFFRALISLILCFIYLRARKISVLGHDKKNLLLRGLWGTLALTCHFYTLQTIPLASAVTLQYLSPIFTIIAASFMLGEKAHKFQWLFFMTAFFGVLLVKGLDPVTAVPVFNIVVGVFAAAAAGVAYTYVRKLRVSDDPMVVVFYFPVVTLPLIGPFAIANWVWPTGWEWLVVIAIGSITQLAQFYMTKALQSDRAERIAIVKYFGVIIAIITGYLIFDEALSIEMALGTAIILLSLILSNRLKNVPKSV